MIMIYDWFYDQIELFLYWILIETSSKCGFNMGQFKQILLPKTGFFLSFFPIVGKIFNKFHSKTGKG